jgi:hypothetical protein
MKLLFGLIAAVLMVGPAFAVPPVTVPEPVSMSLLAVGVGGAMVARTLFRRKK